MTRTKLCEVCGEDATDYRLDALADPHYYCPAHASPPHPRTVRLCDCGAVGESL